MATGSNPTSATAMSSTEAHTVPPATITTGGRSVRSSDEKMK